MNGQRNRQRERENSEQQLSADQQGSPFLLRLLVLLHLCCFLFLSFQIRRFTTDAAEILPALLSFLHATYSPHYQPPLKFAIAYGQSTLRRSAPTRHLPLLCSV